MILNKMNANNKRIIFLILILSIFVSYTTAANQCYSCSGVSCTNGGTTTVYIK